MPAFSNRPYADIVKAFLKPAHDANRIWTAVISSRYFKGSFDFESMEGARFYLRTQIERRGVDAFTNERDSVEFRSSFVINRETFEVFSLADLDLAYMRSNPWCKGRNACLTPTEHKARAARVDAYLKKRAARNDIAEPESKSMTPANRRLMLECQLAATQSRDMWKTMRATGYGWTWDYYRGWLADARDIRLGRKFRGLGSQGVPHRLQKAAFA